MQSLNIGLKKLRNWIKSKIVLAIVFCLGAYYALSSIAELVLFVNSFNAKERSCHGFEGGWFITTSVLFFCSAWSIVNKNKYSQLFFAGSLIGSSLMIFNAYKQWVGHEYSLVYSEWIIIGLATVAIFVWWPMNIVADSIVNIRSEMQAAVRLKWNSSNACKCLVSMAFANIAITGAIVPLNRYGIRSPLLLLATYLCSLLAFLIITILYSDVKSLRVFGEHFGFLAPRPHAFITAMLFGGAIGASVLYMAKNSLLSPHNRLAEGLGINNVIYLNIILLLAPFWEEVIIRGYLYKAFRQEYSVAETICCILAITVVAHNSLMRSAPFGGCALLILNIILSLFREKEKSIWNCIICHFVYNAICVFA